MKPLFSSVLEVARPDVATLPQDLTVQQALDSIRKSGIGEKIAYFYVVDKDECLVGVLPIRRLLTGSLEQRLADVMHDRVVAIPNTATVLTACELFALHKFLAFPVVDEHRHIIGVVNIDMLTDEAVNAAERKRMDEVFEAVGFRASQIRDASLVQAFRFRFPWLLATIGSGTICALLASVYAVTLAKSLVLTFFLTLVLGLGESVSMQSMTVTIYALRTMHPTWGWYLAALRREAAHGILLGMLCGVVVGLTVWLWRDALAASAIGGSILLALCAACFWGISLPALLRTLKLDPKIAAGPVTLALTDISTLFFYLSLGALLL